MLQYRHIIITDHWHNTQRRRTCEQHKHVDTRVLFTSADAVDGVSTCDQHSKRGDASLRLVGTTNPQQIEVMEFALIVAKGRLVADFDDYNGDYSRRKRRL